MQLTPHYGTDPLLTLDGDPSAIAMPLVRQRRRMASTLAAFSDDQWSHPTRCEGWDARDVLVHLDGTNAFWTHSLSAGLRGQPTRFLATFDPVTSPARSVEESREQTSAEVLDRFTASTEALAQLVESLDPSDWTMLAEAPPGHLSASAVAHHALWDSWIHERDILLPQSAEQETEPDEVVACLRYAAALGPSLLLTRGDRRVGRLRVDATDPDTSFVVDVSDRVRVLSNGGSADASLTGHAADLVDSLSVRRPFDTRLPDDYVWMVSGLSETFDVVS